MTTPNGNSKPTVIFDAHLDLAWSALGWNRDLNQTTTQNRAAEADMKERGRGANTVGFPEMRQGRIGLALVTLLARANPRGRTILDFRTQEVASAVAQGHLAYYRILERRGVCRMIRDWPQLEKAFTEWNSGRADAPFGWVLSMEGADPIVSPNDVGWWWEEAGLRAVGLAHYGPSAYAHGTGSEGGLTEAGREILSQMEQVGMVLDLTHLSDQSFWEAAERFHGPVLASHNNCRSLTPGVRQFSDDQIRLLIERDAVIGAPMDAWMMVPGWTIEGKVHAMLEDAVRHMDHICQLAGDARHIAIGSDLDGGFGGEQTPKDLDTIADLNKLVPLLVHHGFSQTDLDGIFHDNWLRLFEKAWKRD